MSAISQKSISGITSITTPAGVDNVFTVHTNNTTERIRINSNGNVGIGTDNPTKKLEIYVGSSSIKVEGNDDGSFHIDPNSTGGTQEALIGQANGDLRLLAGAGSYQANRANILLKNNGRLELSSNSSSDIIFKSNTVEKVRITSTGRVGIGTDNPSQEISIWNDSPAIKLVDTDPYAAGQYGQISQSGGILQLTAKGDGATHGGIYLYAQNNSEILNVYRTSDNTHEWYTASSSNSMKMRLLDNGRLGIGTLSPQATLDVTAGGVNNAAFFKTFSDKSLIEFENSAGPVYNTRIGSATIGSGNVGLRFETGIASDRLQAMVIDRYGKVGVNCTPVGMLEVQKNGVPAIIANYNNSKHLQMGAGGSGAGFHLTDGHFFTINHQPYADRGTDNNLTERLRIDSSGHVLIGKTSGDHILDINASSDEIRLTKASTSDYTGIQLDRDASGNAGGYLGLAGNAGHYVNTSVQHDVILRSQSNLLFSTGGATERLRINSSGYVGVKRSTPLANLHTTNNELAIGANPTGATAPNATYDGLVVDGEEASLINIRSCATGNISYGRVAFSDDVRSRGYIDYRHRDGAGGVLEYMSLAVASQERIRIASNGTVILKNTAAAVPRSDFMGSLEPLSQIASTWNAYHSLTRHDAGSSYGPYLMLAKNRNDAYNSNGTVQDNDELGNIAFLGNDGTAFREGARIRGEVDGTPGSSQVPGAITFGTNGGSGVVERLRITSSGELQLNGNTKKLVLPMYRGTFYCDANSYTKFATVTGNNLSSEIELTCHTTINAVVISSSFIIKAGHYQDFWIESRELKYTSLTIKCISNNNQNFDIYAKRNGGSYQSTQSNISFVIIPKNDETVTINSTVNYTGQSIVHSTQTGALKITGTGGVNCDINVAGSITGSSKNFSIEHPLTSLASTKKLVHASIEGPQCDLIYRGKIDLVGGTATVNIDIATGMSDGTFVKLNRDVQCFTSNETGWGAVKGSVSGNILTITAQDNSSTDTISWMVVGERQDDTIKSSSVTDDSGKLIVEPLTNEEPDNSHLHEFYPTS